MKWIKRKLRNWLMADGREELKAFSVNEVHRSDELSSNKYIQFKVYNANGGRVIETRKYDEVRDRSIFGLYAVANDQDLGAEIEKIITMESLK